jgi:ABC-2 type transport system ATP-binding protein
MSVLEARNLTKRFGITCAVDEVGLTVDAGEVRGLLGPNGAGKTTLLRMLLGLVRPDGGTIELFGRELGRSAGAALEGVSGFVEDPSFYPYLSARANLEVLAELDGDGAGTRIDDALEQVELTGRADGRVGGYSSGMRQRLGIAAALLRAPRLLLLDEPTSGLDPAGARFLADLIRALSAEGVAVLLSSHQIGEIEQVCDSFTVLRHGRVVWQGTEEEVRRQATTSAYTLRTSDDARALSLSEEHPRVLVRVSPAGGLDVEARDDALDAFVLELARSNVAVRRLVLSASPLEAMFFALTERPPGGSAGQAPPLGAPTR